jgi:hypothetical protein
VAPTTFPKPPQGIGGILVFPYTAAALGVPGSSATPDPDWDNAPANFFNDFGGCTTGKTSDCYRSETYPAPLYAGENTAPRSVGFDVDRNAQSVAVYIVVAADLRDNPLQLTDLPGDPTLCGEVLNEGVVFGYVASTGDPTLGGGFERRGFCSFTLPDIHLVRATLQLYQASIHGTASATVYADEGPAIVDHLDYGSSLDPGDYLLAALQADIGTLSTDATIEYKSLDVTPSVQDDIVNGRSASQFRLRLATEIGEDAIIDFAGPTQQNPPKLTLAYRNK